MSFESRCIGLVAKNTCILGFTASLVDWYTASISFLTQRAKPQTAVVVNALEIASTDLKLPELEAGKPASMISTPHFSSCLAIFKRSSKEKFTPGVCSRSEERRVGKECGS